MKLAPSMARNKAPPVYERVADGRNIRNVSIHSAAKLKEAVYDTLVQVARSFQKWKHRSRPPHNERKHSHFVAAQRTHFCFSSEQHREYLCSCSASHL